jgi:hypothetical protein
LIRVEWIIYSGFDGFIKLLFGNSQVLIVFRENEEVQFGKAMIVPSTWMVGIDVFRFRVEVLRFGEIVFFFLR